jgi:hypothetical protein
MAGLDPAIHVRPRVKQVVDARAFASPKGLRPRRPAKPGHDGAAALAPYFFTIAQAGSGGPNAFSPEMVVRIL